MNELWKTDFGDAYTERCHPDTQEGAAQIDARAQLFLAIQRQTGISFFGLDSIVEYGCNAGLNLEALRRTWPSVPTIGVEPNAMARTEARAAGHEVIHGELRFDNPRVTVGGVVHSVSFLQKRTPAVGDLAFTAGVLIHVPPTELKEALDVVVQSAKRYVLAIEYFAPKSRMIRYRGLDHAMWLDDFGSHYLKHPDIKRCLGYGFAWKPATGVDNVTWWMFEKVQNDSIR